MSTVMIVDDDRSTVSLLQMLLELDGFKIVTAGRGADAIIAAQKSAPDLVMVDYHLADMRGIEVITQLRAMPSCANIPIIMASGMNVEEDALKAGATQFLTKPFDPSALTPLFNRLIGE